MGPMVISLVNCKIWIIFNNNMLKRGSQTIPTFLSMFIISSLYSYLAVKETHLLLRQGSLTSWSHSEPAQPGWHSQTTLALSRDRQMPCLQMLQDLQPGSTPTDWWGRSLKSCSSLLMRTSWMHPWKPLGVLSVPCRREDNPVDVGMPAKKSQSALCNT